MTLSPLGRNISPPFAGGRVSSRLSTASRRSGVAAARDRCNADTESAEKRRTRRAARCSWSALTVGGRRATLRRMKSSMRALAVLVALQTIAAAQDKPQLPKSQMPDLGRPTRPNDEQPLFNFDGDFLGK